MNCHAYVPMKNAGAEKSFHDIARFLVARGHDVRVIVPFIQDYILDDVQVIKESTENAEHWRWCDLVFTQLNATGMTIQAARHYKKTVVHFARNDNSYESVRCKPNSAIVYNSEWVKRSLNYPIPSFVMPPTVNYRHYDVGGDPYSREYITLINHNENKGALTVIGLAKQMPTRRFLFVDGGYGDQVSEKLPNLTVWGHQADIREVYKVTRLLLMPSKYESWGRTCTEAMCNGIPVIHSGTLGLIENTAGKQWVASSVDEYIAAINYLDSKECYERYSIAGRKRSRELDPELSISNFEVWLMKLANKSYVA